MRHQRFPNILESNNIKKYQMKNLTTLTVALMAISAVSASAAEYKVLNTPEDVLSNSV